MRPERERELKGLLQLVAHENHDGYWRLLMAGTHNVNSSVRTVRVLERADNSKRATAVRIECPGNCDLWATFRFCLINQVSTCGRFQCANDRYRKLLVRTIPFRTFLWAFWEINCPRQIQLLLYPSLGILWFQSDVLDNSNQWTSCPVISNYSSTTIISHPVEPCVQDSSKLLLEEDTELSKSIVRTNPTYVTRRYFVGTIPMVDILGSRWSGQNSN